MLKVALFSLLVAAPLASVSAASSVDNYAASTMMVAGNYEKAATRLEFRVRIEPEDETALLNLALAYRHLGREADAQRTFRRVLKLEDVALSTVDGQTVMAHALAERGLANTMQVSAR